MKEIKKIFYFLMALILIGCIGILVCALQPDLTASLAAKVQEITGAVGMWERISREALTPIQEAM